MNKKLSLYGLIMIAIGACIGSGIFLTPNVVAKNIPHTHLVILIWFLGGIISICGALTFAELGSRFPRSGGVYAYIKEAYGDFMGFSYGWVILLVINTGALAALSVGMINFLGFYVEMNETIRTFAASSTILVLTIINVFGVSISEWFANIFTGAKLLAIIFIITVACFISPQIDYQNAINLQVNSIPENLFQAFFISLIGVFWSFGGWHHTSYLAEEAKNAKRNIPLAMIVGTGIVTIAYVLVNFAYMKGLPLETIKNSERVAAEALEAFIPGGGKLVTILVIVSITGTVAIYTMSAPRIYYAMAKDKIFFPALSKLHPSFKTPLNAMFLQAFWAILLVVVWKKFITIITFVTFMDILFMMIAASSIFVFRHRKNDILPNVKALGYPFVPALYVIITFIFVINTALLMPTESWAGLIILIIGYPAYLYFKKTNATS